MSIEQQAIAVVGAGPVGSMLAAFLAKAGRPVAVVEPGPRREQIAQVGLQVTGRLAASERPSLLLGDVAQLREHRARIGACFVCTKTWALRSLLPALAAALDPGTLVVSFQNGIGPEDEVARFFAPSSVGRGIANYAGGAEPDGRVTMQWFNPPNYLAPVEAPGSPLLGSLAGDLSAAGLTTEPVDAGQIRKKAFLKAILNAGLSALCASSGITMRQAMTWPHTRALAARLVREGLGVAAAEGFHYGDEALETCMCYLDQGGDHMPSMWYDLANKTRTEIDYINGQIARIGLAREGVDVRANVLIASLVVTQEIKSGARAPNDIPEYLTHD